MRQLHSFLEESSSNDNDTRTATNSSTSTIPFQKLCYVVGECNYGGRVTDDKDRRLINSILQLYFNHNNITIPNPKLSDSGTYFIPTSSTVKRNDGSGSSDDESGEDDDEDSLHGSSNDTSIGGSSDFYVNYIKSLPLNAQPEVFKMHPNASITKEKQETQALFDAMLLTAPTRGSSSGSKADTPESIVDSICSSILAKLPKDIDVVARLSVTKFPVSYGESMNTVIVQELGRFSNLLQVIEVSFFSNP